MRRSIAALCVGALLSGAAAPDQEADMGSRITRPKRAEFPQGNLAPHEQARATLARFAECVFARRPAMAVEATKLPSGDDGSELARLANSDCLDAGSMQFSSSLFRGALFAQMYRRHETTDGKAWPYPIQPLAMDAVPPATSSEDVRSNFFMLQLTECLHEKDSESVRGVIVNPVLSKAQNDAFAKLIPLLGACIPQGVTLTLNKTTLENGFGEYLYRSLATPTQPNTTDTR